MKTAAIGCLIAALGSVALGLRLGWPVDARQTYNRAHNGVEEIAFRKDGTAELQKAVVAERMAEKNLYVTQDLGRRMIWLSSGLTAVALFLAVFERRRPGP